MDTGIKSSSATVRIAVMEIILIRMESGKQFTSRDCGLLKKSIMYSFDDPSLNLRDDGKKLLKKILLMKSVTQQNGFVADRVENEEEEKEDEEKEDEEKEDEEKEDDEENQEESNTNATEILDTSLYQGFIQWILSTCLANIYPGPDAMKTNAALTYIGILVDVNEERDILPELPLQLSSILISILASNPFEHNRRLALKILFQLEPHLKSFETEDSLTSLVETGLSLINHHKTLERMRGAALWRLIAKKFDSDWGSHESDRTAVRASWFGDNSNDNSQGKSIINHFSKCKSLLNSLPFLPRK